MSRLKLNRREVLLSFISLLNYVHYVKAPSRSSLIITGKVLAVRSLNIF